MRQIRFLFWLVLPTAALAQDSVTLIWNPNPEADLGGYRLHYGTRSGALTEVIQVGKTPTARVSGLLPSTTYFFAVQAVNLSGKASNLSREIPFRTAAPPAPEIDVSGPGAVALTSSGDGISFGPVRMPAAAASWPIRVKNSGSAPLTGLALAMQGDHPSDFLTDTTLPTSLAAGAEVWLNIAFKPAAEGERRARLVIASNDSDENPFVIPLAGTALAPEPVLRPEIQVTLADGSPLPSGPLDFGDLLLNATSRKIELMIRNTGDAALSGMSAALIGSEAADFMLLPATVPTQLAPGTETLVSLAFQPASPGKRAAVLRIAPGIPGRDPIEIPLSGRGLGVPNLVVQVPGGAPLGNGAALPDFAKVDLGKSSEPRVLQLRNTGSADLTGVSISLIGSHPGDFQIDAPPALLKPGALAGISLRFTPTAAGERRAVLRIASNDPGRNPLEIALSGTGEARPEIAVSGVDDLEFTSGSALIGFDVKDVRSPAASRVLRIRNRGNAALNGLWIRLSGEAAGDFRNTPLTALSLAPNESTEFTLTFAPQAPGIRHAMLNIASNDADENPFAISLSGNVGVSPRLVVADADGGPLPEDPEISFGSAEIGKAAAAVILTLRNAGDGELNRISATWTGPDAADFTVQSQPSTIAAGGIGQIILGFKPGAAGPRRAVLRITSNDEASGPTEMAVVGNGLPRPAFRIEGEDGGVLASGTAALPFGEVKAGSGSASVTLVIRNTGGTELAGISAGISGSPAFTISTPAASLAAGATSRLTATFTPTSGGPHQALLRITANGVSAPYELPLGGWGATAPEIEVRDAQELALSSGKGTSDFGSRDLRAPALKRSFLVRNTGNAALTGIRLITDAFESSGFTLESTAPRSLAPGASFPFTVGFRPTQTGIQEAAIRIGSNDADENPFVLRVRGTGTAAPEMVITLAKDGSPASPDRMMDFGKTDLGGESAPVVYQIRNRGSAPLMIESITTTGPAARDFVLTGPPRPSIEAGGMVEFSIRFKPSAAGRREASFSLRTNHPAGDPAPCPLTGFCITKPKLELLVSNKPAPGTLRFGETRVGESSGPRTLVLRNAGNADLTDIRVGLTGRDRGDFPWSAGSLTRLAPGETAELRVDFQPSAAGPREAQLKVLSNDPENGSRVLALTGTGLASPRIELRDGGGLVLEKDNAFMDLVSGKPRIIRIINTGSAPLTGISASLRGPHAGDFRIREIPEENLAPGDSTTIRVSFPVERLGIRWATLRIASNDPEQSLVVVDLTGRSASSNSSRGTSPRSARVDRVDLVKGSVSIGGERYRSLTLENRDGSHEAADVEVSSNLVDWFSGPRHTTVIRDSGGVLKVRDNTPLAEGTKRHIRLRGR